MGAPMDNLILIMTLLPEIMLVLLALLVLGFDLGMKNARPSILGWVTAIGLIIIAIFSIGFSGPPPVDPLVWGGMLRLDLAARLFRMLFLIGAALTSMLAMEDEENNRGEFYFLLIISTLGLSLLAAAADLIMVFLSLELASIPLYVLAGFKYRDNKSVEAGLKYMLYGAVSSTVMLFGFTFLYGFSGTTQLYAIGGAIQAGHIPPVALTMSVLLILAGFGYKISAVPFHFWAPDVYEGAPTVVAGYLSTVSKAGGFAVLLRFSFSLFPLLSMYVPYVLAAMAVASMVIGNLLALNQKNFKRFLAYSSIAQAGYVLVGVAASSGFGTAAVIYYLIGYLVTNLTAFAIASVVSRDTGTEDISGLAGLTDRAPMLAFALLISLLSLGGVPPFAGFIGKLFVFSAAMKSGMAWLVIVAVLNSVLSLFYYLKVLKIAFLDKAKDAEPIRGKTGSWKLAFLLCLAGILILGVIIQPWFLQAAAAASSLIIY
jgi:NADH-quinone oxidoreductase subunit N